MIVMIKILLWIKCIHFFLLFFHYVSGLLTDQLFNFCLKKNLLHFTFPSRFYGCLSMSPPKVIQVATNVLFICQYISTTLLHCTALDYIFSPKQWKIRKIGNLTLDYIPGKNKKIMNYFEKQIINKIYVSSDQLFR